MSTSRVATLAALLCCPGLSRAQSADGSRRALVEQALTASHAGDHARALDLFTQAGRIQMRPGLRLALSEEHQVLGHLREACEQARACVDEVQRQPESDRVSNGCLVLARDTCGTFGMLTVDATSPIPEGFVVRVDGRTIDPVANPLVAVDPGTVHVEAHTTAGASFARVTTVARGAVRELTIAWDPPPPSDLPAPTPTPTPAIALPAATSHAGVRQGPGAWPWIVMGAGLASLGAAAYFGLVALPGAHYDDALARCLPSLGCPPGGAVATAHTQAATAALETNIALGVGAGALALGVLWYVIAPRFQAPAETMASLRWGVTPTAGGLTASVGGTL